MLGFQRERVAQEALREYEFKCWQYHVRKVRIVYTGQTILFRMRQIVHDDMVRKATNFVQTQLPPIYFPGPLDDTAQGVEFAQCVIWVLSFVYRGTHHTIVSM